MIPREALSWARDNIPDVTSRTWAPVSNGIAQPDGGLDEKLVGVEGAQPIRQII